MIEKLILDCFNLHRAMLVGRLAGMWIKGGFGQLVHVRVVHR